MEILLRISIGYVMAILTASLIIGFEVWLENKAFQRVFSQIFVSLLAIFLTINFIFPRLV